MVPDLIQNQRVVYSRDLPRPPQSFPDPESCKTFPEWLRELTEKHGVKQRDVAEVAGLTPQSVTKWLKGGMIGVGPLSQIAEWVGIPYLQLRRLLDESKVGLMPMHVSDAAPPNYLRGDTGIPADFVKTWARLDSESRRQVQSLAKLLASKNGKRK